MRKIYYMDDIAGDFMEVHGTRKWPAIEHAITNSQICLFDVTKEIFNVAYEFGFSVAQSFNPNLGDKKHIIVGSSEEHPENHVLANLDFLITPLLSQERELSTDILDNYRPNLYDQLDETNCIQYPDKNIRELTTIHLKKGEKNIIALLKEFYPTISYPTKPPKFEIAVLTKQDLFHNYRSIDFSNEKEHNNFIDPNNFFRDIDNSSDLIEKISTEFSISSRSSLSK